MSSMTDFLTVGKLIDKLSTVNPEAKVLMLVPYGHPTYADAMFSEVDGDNPTEAVLLVGTVELGREP
jgi:hypothetical protein